MRNALRFFLLCLLKTSALLGFLSCGAVHAAANSFDGYAVASNEELDSMRGGFEFSANGTQFLLAFTYDQVSVVNGVVVAVTSLNLLQLLNGGTLASALTTRLLAPPPTVADATHAATSGAGSATLSVSPRLAANLAQVDKVFSPDHPNAQDVQVSTTQVQRDQLDTQNNVGTSLIDKTGGHQSLPSPIATPASNPPMSTATTSSGSASVPVPAVAATPAAGVQVNSVNGMTLITSGPGNTFDSQALNNLSTFIQNTVNDQVIRNVTILSATIASANWRLTELNAALSRGIAAATR